MWCNIDFGSSFSVYLFIYLFLLFCFCIVNCSLQCRQTINKLTWMEGLVRTLSTVFQAYRDDGRVNMKGSVQ